MNIKTIKDITELKGKTVLIRVDFNVPIQNGEIQDDTRIKASLDTIKELSKKGAKIVVITHLGRPKGKIAPDLKLDKIAERLSELLKKDVKKIDELDLDEVKKQIQDIKEKEVVMLENIRFWPEEEKCAPEFCQKLAELGDLFVNDAFATAHREHASSAGIAKHLPAYGGLLMEKEIQALSPLVEEEIDKPVTMILGGAKIDTKIGLIKQFFDKVDYFLIGGGLANTFLFAAGYNIGKSLCQEDKLNVAQEIMLECEKHQEKFIIPHDVVVASELSNDAETADIPVEDVIGDMKILDIGKWTAEKYANIITESKTVIWNGPVGVCEYTPFQNGSRVIAETIAEHDCKSIIGGGDTLECLKTLNIPTNSYTHVSTGGGACIEFLEGKTLPGIKALLR